MVEYYESPATRSMHALPRFGYPSDFALLLGTEEQRSEYIYGLLFAGVFILAFFIVWCVVLAIFKCLGSNKIGMFSGSPMRVSESSKRPMIVRIVFIISSMFVVAFSALLVTQGLTQLRNGVVTVYDSSVEVGRILGEVDELVTALDNVGQSAVPIRDELVTRLANDTFCPNVDLSAQTGEDFDTIIDDAVVFLEDLGDFEGADVSEAKHVINKAQETTATVSETSDQIAPDDWQSLIFIVPFSIFAVLFVLGVALAWCGRVITWYTCILSWLVLPLFIILVVICFLLSAGIAIAASANADFCAGGEDRTPEGTIQHGLLLNGYSEDDLAVQLVTFYIKQCEALNPLDYLTAYETELAQADEAVQQFEEAVMNVTLDGLTEICGEDYSSIQVLAEAVISRLAQLVKAATGVVAALSCENIAPLYTSAVYNGACEYSIEGVTWTFASFLVIAVFGMLMITFRSAYLPTQDADDDKFQAMGPMDYTAPYEVEYDPAKALPLEDGGAEESYGLEQAGNGGANAATGVAVGAAATGAAVAGVAVATSSMHDESNPQEDGSQQVDGNQESIQQSHPASFDKANWLDDDTVPIGAQY